MLVVDLLSCYYFLLFLVLKNGLKIVVLDAVIYSLKEKKLKIKI